MKHKTLLYLNIILLISFCGCAMLSSLQQAKTYEGITRQFKASYDEVVAVAKAAPEATGLKTARINNQNPNRVEILCESLTTETDYGALFGIFVYPEKDGLVPVQIVMRKKTAANIFVHDYTEDLFTVIIENLENRK
ncbi:MAG: hypothetical protein P9M03_10890 [Candidatus Theseobacter exili]|nr:hypothetical protein [Candidatus Theseobacter exili]